MSLHIETEQLTVVTSRTEISVCQKNFQASVESLGTLKRKISIGYQGGQVERLVSWIPELNLWAYFGFPNEDKSPGERYWSVFGRGEPTKLAHIACEINSPLSGRSKRTGGVFLVKGHNYYLAHRGNINARGRIPQKWFFSRYQGQIIEASDDSNKTRLALIGNIANPKFPNLLNDFVDEIIRIKTMHRRAI